MNDLELWAENNRKMLEIERKELLRMHREARNKAYGEVVSSIADSMMLCAVFDPDPVRAGTNLAKWSTALALSPLVSAGIIGPGDILSVINGEKTK